MSDEYQYDNEPKLPALPARDYIYLLMEDFDIDAQVAAMRAVLKRQQQDEEELAKTIEQIDAHARSVRGMANEHAIDEWLAHCHASGYQDSAHSMAAVGMLAPLAETLFKQCFQGVQRLCYPQALPATGHLRWSKPNGSKLWDCHYHLDANGSWTNGLVQGVIELATATGLDSYLPRDFGMVLDALFAYRNSMFHNGLEWPVSERERFSQRLSSWPLDWFSSAETNDQPWMFYITPAFVLRCFDLIEEAICAFGKYVADHPCA